MWQMDDSTVDEFISVSNGQFRHVCHNKVLLKLGERRMTFQNIEAFHAIFAKLRRSKFTEHFELIKQGSAWDSWEAIHPLSNRKRCSLHVATS